MKAIIQFLVNCVKTGLAVVNRFLDNVQAVMAAVLKFCFGWLAPLKQLFKPLLELLKDGVRILLLILCCALPFILVTLISGKIYQGWDDDPDRGAIAIDQPSMGETYSTPVYIDQGWDDPSDSLWFYNTTQGSNLLPYDFFVELEQEGSEKKFIDPNNIDALRYLPQKATFFNPDALPLGFVKDTYLNRDYVGPTCAACHTGQVNYQGKAVRIDGGPATADMVKFLQAMYAAMNATLQDDAKFSRFADAVIKRNNWKRNLFGGKGYSSNDEVRKDLEIWANRTWIYNNVNHSDVDYGYARLDAFGRIYNRVLEHMLEKDQIGTQFSFVTYPNGRRVLTNNQIEEVLTDLDKVVIGQSGFEKIVGRLIDMKISEEGILLLGDALFNPADAPVSYPFLWDIAQSDFVQWNGLASNGGLGPLGRNTGEVIGVFGTLDWTVRKKNWFESFNLAAKISGQTVKDEVIDFKSSIDKVNLTRLESHLKSLTSPQWKDVEFLPKINPQLKEEGRLLYARYCQSCHEVVDRDNWDRRVIANMMAVEKIKTDPKMVDNSTSYTGSSGNLKDTYQGVGVGNVIMAEQAPVVQILTAATGGVIGTPDPDKGYLRRLADWLYTVVGSFLDNPIKGTIKIGDYQPDTTANPYASLRAYKGRSLNGIWATAPYLHNGSVPTIYDLLLPKKRPGDPEGPGYEYRPDRFAVGCRELDAEKVGVKCNIGVGQLFDTSEIGNWNAGHEYAAGVTPPLGASEPLPKLDRNQRLALVEYIKSL